MPSVKHEVRKHRSTHARSFKCLLSVSAFAGKATAGLAAATGATAQEAHRGTDGARRAGVGSRREQNVCHGPCRRCRRLRGMIAGRTHNQGVSFVTVKVMCFEAPLDNAVICHDVGTSGCARWIGRC